MTKTKKGNSWESVEHFRRVRMTRNSRRLERNILLPHTCRSIRDSWNDGLLASWRRSQSCCRDFYRKSSMTQVQRDLFIRRAAEAAAERTVCGREKKIHPYETEVRRIDQRLSLPTKLRYDFSPLLLSILIDRVARGAESPWRWTLRYFDREIFVRISGNLRVICRINDFHIQCIICRHSRGFWSRVFWLGGFNVSLMSRKALFVKLCLTKLPRSSLNSLGNLTGVTAKHQAKPQSFAITSRKWACSREENLPRGNYRTGRRAFVRAIDRLFT